MQSPDEPVPPLSDPETIAPPGYGEHVLDRLYDDVLFGGFQTPENQSGTNSPYYHPSATASSESLAHAAETGARTRTDPAIVEALASRLQTMSASRSRRNSVHSMNSGPPDEMSRRPSHENSPSGRVSPEHADETILEELNKVPSYATAVRTPARPRSYIGLPSMLPMYEDIEPDVSSSPAILDDSATRSEPERTESTEYDSGDIQESSPAEQLSDFSSTRSESLSSQGSQRSQRPQTAIDASQPRTVRPRPLSGFSDALLQRLSNHAYGHYGHGLDPRPYQGMRPTMQCM